MRSARTLLRLAAATANPRGNPASRLLRPCNGRSSTPARPERCASGRDRHARTRASSAGRNRGPGVVAVLAAAALFTAGCSEDRSWNLKDVSGLMPDLEFRLTRAADGETVTAADYSGRVRVVYFGFTNCPDVCPVTLARFKQALQELGPAADDVRVLFISVDPERDTRERLAQYVDAFGDRFVGLRGPIPRLREITKRYRVTFSHGEPDENGFYDVSHSTAAFIFDRDGDIRLLARSQSNIDAIAADLERLVNE